MASKYLLRTSQFSFPLTFGFLVLFGGAASVWAQRVVTQDAGGGRKIELHYNAANQVTETRTLDAEGKLLEKDTLEYPAGSLIPHSVATSYWPNGQAHKVTRNSYDNNSNFTGEFIQLFDESGKQIGGHRLTHYPLTNVYRCEEWNVAANDYKLVECPAGEESSGAPEVAKKFTAEEVNQQLTQARQSSRPAPTQPSTAPQGAAGPSVKEVGLVLPAEVRSGERVSGSVVEDPSAYEEMPDVSVTRFAIPFASSGAGANLAGWQIELAGERPQAADEPITFNAPRTATVTVLFRQAEDGAPVSKSITLALTNNKKSKAATSYLASPVCLKSQLCVVEGPFTGDSSKTFAALEQRPAKVIAETSDTAFIAIPDATEPGPRPLVISEGNKVIAFPMVVAAFTIRPPRRDLPKGENLLMYPTVSGPEEIPDTEWRPGSFPASNLALARKLVPDFKPMSNNSDHEAKEAEERRERAEKRKASGKRGENEKQGAGLASSEKEDEANEGGEILLIVKNTTPEVANFRDSKDGMYVFRLQKPSFKMGDFLYKFVVEAKQTGNFGLNAYVIPFLAPIQGQEFALK